eukprot:TRINITY_DN45823_c0_g2_i1.p1 TRINITY_DN45823_c0_g2~~TRINITY_DN45823_c0_g2_i1.p1  ORF type:complete len:567 (-),score=74.23 TRINITY_DN45823_c0_g2_i1:28-1584(-)
MDADEACSALAHAAWHHLVVACSPGGFPALLGQSTDFFSQMAAFLQFRSLGSKPVRKDATQEVHLCGPSHSILPGLDVETTQSPVSIGAISAAIDEDYGLRKLRLLLHAHPVDSSDFSLVESHGLQYIFTLPSSNFWLFRCVWTSVGLRTAATVHSRLTVLSVDNVEALEPERREAASLLLECQVPPEVEHATIQLTNIEIQVGPDWLPRYPMPSLGIALCPSERPKNEGLLPLVVCTEPMYSLDVLRERWTGYIEAWLDYHFRIGVAEIAVYDTDGSLGPVLAGYARRHQVRYYGKFPSLISEAFYSHRGSAAKSELLAYDHCVMNYRHSAQRLMRLHSVDDWLVPSEVGAKRHLEVLRQQKDASAAPNILADLEATPLQRCEALHLSRVDFLGHFNADATSPVRAWRERLRRPLREHLKSGDALGTVIVDPRSVDHLTTHGVIFTDALRGRVVDFPAWETFHYYDLFRNRSGDCTLKPYGSPAWMRDYIDALCVEGLGETILDDRLVTLLPLVLQQ